MRVVQKCLRRLGQSYFPRTLDHHCVQFWKLPGSKKDHVTEGRRAIDGCCDPVENHKRHAVSDIEADDRACLRIIPVRFYSQSNGDPDAYANTDHSRLIQFLARSPKCTDSLCHSISPEIAAFFT